MKKGGGRSVVTIVLIIGAILFGLFIIIPLLSFVLLGSSTLSVGNVALIPIEGVITTNGAAPFGQAALSSKTIVDYIEQANENPQIKIIVLEINSPGGSPVASDEIAQAVKQSEKPVVSVIRELGASGGYWIASATEHIIANRMSITGSIGVISSYLEFSGLMNEHGIGYERFVAGKYKDIGTPFKKLNAEERGVFQGKLDTIYEYFVEEVAQNRGLTIEQARAVATGEFYLGSEAFTLGLVDELGDKTVLEQYLKKTYELEDVNYVTYERQPGLLEALSGVLSESFFSMGEGIGSRVFHRGQIMT